MGTLAPEPSTMHPSAGHGLQMLLDGGAEGMDGMFRRDSGGGHTTVSRVRQLLEASTQSNRGPRRQRGAQHKAGVHLELSLHL